MRPLNEIIIHCAATRPEWMSESTVYDKIKEIRSWHISRGWRDIGYHYIIDRDGRIGTGRPVEQTGAHVRGHNTGSIGVCLIGGHGSSENDAPLDNYTQVQMDALTELLKNLKDRFPSITKVTGHNQYAAKACPGFNVPRWLAKKTPARESLKESTTMQAGAAGSIGAVSGVVTAVSSLEGTTQMIVVGVSLVSLLALGWMMRERIKKWTKGVK